MAKLVLVVAIIVFLGAVLGVAGYLARNKPAKSLQPTQTSVLMPTLSPVAVELNELTVESLINEKYDTEIGKIIFKEGKYKDDPFYAEIISNGIAFGDLNNDDYKDAAVVYYYTGGGSGSFYFINVVINQNGKSYHGARIDLGDRVEMNSVEIKENKIIVDMVIQGPYDGMCCPTLRKIFEYEL